MSAKHTTSPRPSYRRVLRSIRLMREHAAEVKRVADELGKRGLVDLADDLRQSLKTIASMAGGKP